MLLYYNILTISIYYANCLVEFQNATELMGFLEKLFVTHRGFRKLLPRQMVRSREVQLEDGKNNYKII